jgi:hypothetical protein
MSTGVASFHFGMAGGGGIFAAVSFAATGDGGAELVDESSPQPVIAPTKTNNAKTRTARCMREPPQMGMLLTVVTKPRCWRGRRGSRQHLELVNERPASRTLAVLRPENFSMSRY